jgi:hypothetical protein
MHYKICMYTSVSIIYICIYIYVYVCIYNVSYLNTKFFINHQQNPQTITAEKLEILLSDAYKTSYVNKEVDILAKDLMTQAVEMATVCSYALPLISSTSEEHLAQVCIYIHMYLYMYVDLQIHVCVHTYIFTLCKDTFICISTSEKHLLQIYIHVNTYI